jgi:photosystem II stability/assembly factor-like uncharacterized protein
MGRYRSSNDWLSHVLQFSALFLSVLALMIPGVCAESLWTRLGPDGGQISAIAVDPQDSATIYAASTGTIYKSTNGGDSWYFAGKGLNTAPYAGINALVIDPRNSAIVYAGTSGGIFKSINRGESWSVTIRNIPATALVIDPGNSSVLYAGTSKNEIYKSTDGGTNWKFAEISFSGITSLAINPQNPAVLYASTRGITQEMAARVPAARGSNSPPILPGPGRIYKTSDAGSTWNAIGPQSDFTAVAIDPKNSEIVYAAFAGTVWNAPCIYKSVNGGADWTIVGGSQRSGGPRGAKTLLIDPQRPNIFYLTSNFVGYKSMNGGDTWTVYPASTAPLINCFAIDPRNPDIVYAGTDSMGVYKSTDGGMSWKPANSGFSALTIGQLALHPKSPETLYAEHWGKLYKSTNSGGTWKDISWARLKSIDLAIDPQDPNTIYAGSNPFFKSTDGGAQWSELIIDPAANPEVQAIAISPQNPSILYVGTSKNGVYKSVDGGAKWTAAADRGLPVNIVNLVIDPQNPANLIAGISFKGLFRSTDSGENWSVVNGIGDYMISDIAIAPQSPSVVFAGTNHGVFKSLDGGISWIPSGNEPEQYSALFKAVQRCNTTKLAIDPQNPSTVYVGTYGCGVFRSTDAGRRWVAMNEGLTEANITALALDPETKRLYAGTANFSVWVYFGLRN